MSVFEKIAIKKSSILYAYLHIVVLVILTIYVVTLIDPVLTDGGYYDNCYPVPYGYCNLELWDSLRYYDLGKEFDIKEDLYYRIEEFKQGNTVLFGFTNYALLVFSNLTQKIFPFAPQLLVLYINYILLLFALHNYKKILEYNNIYVENWVYMFIVFNPFLLVLIVSITKEAFGIYFVSAFCRYILENSRGKLLTILIVSALFREIFFVIGLFMWILVRFRIKIVYFLIGVSVLVTIIDWFPHSDALHNVRYFKAEVVGTESARLMSVLAHVQSLPLGHIVAGPIIISVNTIGPVINPKYYMLSVHQIMNYALLMSSYLFLLIFIVGIYRKGNLKLRIKSFLAKMIVVYLFVSSIYPLSQQRYYIPVYPLIVLWAFSKKKQINIYLNKSNIVLTS